MEWNEFVTKAGEVILYKGNVDYDILEFLAGGVGDIWHSSFEQGYKNVFQELVYQTATFFWYLNDFDNLDECVSWRINPNAFAIRKSIWETLGGFDSDYKNAQIQALDFGFNALCNAAAVPLYVKGLFQENSKIEINISEKDRYVFFLNHFTCNKASNVRLIFLTL